MITGSGSAPVVVSSIMSLAAVHKRNKFELQLLKYVLFVKISTQIFFHNGQNCTWCRIFRSKLIVILVE